MVFALKYGTLLAAFLPYSVLFFLYFLWIVFPALISIPDYFDSRFNSDDIIKDMNIKQAHTLSFSIHKNLRKPTIIAHLLCAGQPLILITGSAVMLKQVPLEKLLFWGVSWHIRAFERAHPNLPWKGNGEPTNRYHLWLIFIAPRIPNVPC